MRFSEYVMLIIIIILLILLGVSQIKPPEIRTIVQTDTVLVRDTITIVQKGKIQYKIREIKDTIIVYDSTNFISCIDTNIKKTNMFVCYQYPENLFRIDLKFTPDTVRTTTVIEKPIFKYEQKKEPWYYDALKIGGGVVVGFIIGKVR